MNRRLRLILSFIRQLGFDPTVLLRTLRNVPRFIGNYLSFRRMMGNGSTQTYRFSLSPALQDRSFNAGQADGHYFWQDLICAKWIHGEPYRNHIDVGSRIDGFIAHLLSFMDVKLIDIRPLHNAIPGLTVEIFDIMSPDVFAVKEYMSVSSLHSIEHFGLGRYGDPLNTVGHEKGLRVISTFVAPGGNLFVSFPIGKSRIEFDSQRILSPMFALEILDDFNLIRFALIPWKGEPELDVHPSEVDISIEGQAGLYWLRRKNGEKN